MSRERGVLIESHNPQPEVRKNAETAIGWEFKEEAAYQYKLAVIFRDRLIDPILHTDRDRVPDPVISFEDMRNNNILAAYTLARNPQGLLHEITFNTAHYEDKEGKKAWKYGRWAQAESLLHEQLHLKQQKYGKEPYKRGKVTHNREFVEMAKQLGLNVMPNVGCHIAPADEGSPFDILMKELGIPRPTDVPTVEEQKGRRFDWFEIGKKEKGRSSLSKWQCPECGLNVRIGIKGNPEIIHGPCTLKKGDTVFFIPVDGLAQATLGMVEPPKKEEKKPEMSEEASEELDKEFERRRDWNAFYKDKYGPYPGSPPEDYEPDYGDL